MKHFFLTQKIRRDENQGNWDWNWYECEERGGGENGKWIDSGIESKQDEDKSNGVEEKGWGGHQT